MKLGLSMVIKDEAKNLRKFFGNIYDLFDDIVIIDTGSEDDTISILKEFNIDCFSYHINHGDQRLVEARNLSIEKNKVDWVLILDGDEFISREDIKKIKDMDLDFNIQGCFIKRIDHRYGNPFEDYKMCLINKNYVRFLFNVHACPQVYVRDNEGKGIWLNGINLHHYPEHRAYREQYIIQIQNGILENPGCLRFYRFLGYYYFKNGLIKEAKNNLEFVMRNINKRFPVECLNACMVLASIYQKEGNHILSYQCIENGLDFFDIVKNDFEVKINFRIYAWFLNTHNTLLNDFGANIIPYEFAF